MTRPAGIPQDIWITVDALPICGEGFPDEMDYETIARAILAERSKWAARVALLEMDLELLYGTPGSTRRGLV